MGHRFEDDDEVDGAPPPRRRDRASGSGLVGVLSILGIVAWGLLLVVILGGGLLFMVSLGKANNAPQEAAIGAVFSTAFIGLYILARCVEKILAGVQRMQAKPDGERQ